MSGYARITAEFLRRCIALGMDNEHILPVVEYMDRDRDGTETVEIILSSLEATTSQPDPPGFMKRFAENMLERLGPLREPANDRIVRMSSGQRRTAYGRIAERDGEWCAECRCEAGTIWRRMGLFSTEEGFRYTKVFPTSNLEVDHKTPIWAGGDNALSNLWLLCIDCHKAKTAKESCQRRRRA